MIALEIIPPFIEPDSPGLSCLGHYFRQSSSPSPIKKDVGLVENKGRAGVKHGQGMVAHTPFSPA